MNPRYSRYYTFIQPVFKNNTFQTYGILVFSLITIIFFLIFAVRPTILTIISLQKTIKQQNMILDEANKKSDDLTSARNEYNALDPDTKSKVLALIPTSASLPCFLNYISTLAIAEEATISSIQVEPTNLAGTSECIIEDTDITTEKATLSEIDFTMNAQGNFESVVSFLENLKKLNRLIMVDTATMSKSSDNNPINLSVTGRIFYLDNTPKTVSPNPNQ